MKTFQERMKNLDKAQQRVAKRLLEEVVVGSCAMDERVIDRDNYTFDVLGTMMYERVKSTASLLAGILKYNDDIELLHAISKTTK